MIVFWSVLLTAQTPNWIFHYNGPGSENDNANCMCYGLDSTLYVAGYSVGIGTDQDAVVISLTSAGDTNWIYRNESPYYDAMDAIVYGPDNNIYAAGHEEISANEGNMFILRLEHNGSYPWFVGIGGSGYNAACAMACGTDNNIYVAGTVDSTQEFAVTSVTNGGDFNWMYTYNGPGNGYDVAVSVVWGPDGNIYAAGYSEGVSTGADMTVISLTTSGDTNWVYRYNGSINGDDAASSIIYGSDGNLYICGSSATAAGDDFTVISLSRSGQERWVYRYDGPLNTDDGANDLCYGADGNIYVTGDIDEIGTGSDLIAVSLDTLGNERWIYTFDGPGTYWDWGRSIVYGADGNLYIAGSTSGSSTYMDFTVISLTPSGDTNWVYTYNASGNEGDFASQAVYGLDGTVYAAGKSSGFGTYDDLLVISLNPTGIEEHKEAGLKSSAGIIANPNPFRTITTLTLQYEGRPKSLNIYDTAGRLVKSFDHIASGGSSINTIKWTGEDNAGGRLSSGIYFAVLKTADSAYTARLVLAR